MLFVKVIALVLLIAVVMWVTSEFICDLDWDNTDEDDEVK